MKEISQHKVETINAGICYKTLEISYIIHTLRYNGKMVQRRNGIKAQWHKGVTMERRKGRGAQGHKSVTAKSVIGKCNEWETKNVCFLSHIMTQAALPIQLLSLEAFRQIDHLIG